MSRALLDSSSVAFKVELKLESSTVEFGSGAPKKATSEYVIEEDGWRFKYGRSGGEEGMREGGEGRGWAKREES
jgi:hypothetical protein